MQIDHCLILAAGLGTRMGEIGKLLPKALWPIFDKTLLELQVQYAKDLGIKNISVNCHFLAEQIKTFVEKNKIDIQVLEEKQLLDVGGAIYNYKANNPSATGNLLLLNSDLFLFFSKKILEDAVLNMKGCKHASLFAIKVEKGTGYNETCIEKGVLTRITKAIEIEADSDYYTYSGVGLINLDKLDDKVGVQSFFDTVADFRTLQIGMTKLDCYEYCDFGTIKRYYSSIYGIKDDKFPKMHSFLIKNESLISGSISKSEIRCKELILKNNTIYFNGVVEKLE